MNEIAISSNTVFYENLKSLIRLANESLRFYSNSNNEFQDNLLNKNYKEYDIYESSHLQNADWILLNSIFTSMFSHLEYKLYLFCKAIEKSECFKIRIDNLNGSTLEKYFNYLNLIANIESATRKEKKYQTLTLFQKTRNKIVHNGGMIITNKTEKLETHELYKFLQDKKVVIAGKSGIIRIINIDFLEDFSLLCRQVCDEIGDEINKKFR